MTLFGIALASNAIRRSRAGVLPLLLAALLPTFGALSTPAEALEVVTGDGAGCRVAPEQVVNDDLLLLCEEAVIQGTVHGDLYFAGRSLVVSGRVDGDVFGFGNDLTIDGSVGLSLRGAAQTVRVAGDLGRGLAAAGEQISILPGASVGGSVMAAGDRLTVAGPVGGSVLAAGGRLEVDAAIEGNLKYHGEALHLGSQARIGGSANYTGPSEPEREPGASAVEWSEPEPEEESAWDTAMSLLTRWGMGIALGLVLVLLASGPLGAMAAIGGRPVAPLLLGLLLFVGLPFAAILLAITFIGLPIAFAVGALYLFLLFAARVVAAMVIGQAILGLASTNVQRIGRIALGLGILVLAVEVPVHRRDGHSPRHVLRPRRLRALGVALAAPGGGRVGPDPFFPESHGHRGRCGLSLKHAFACSCRGRVDRASGRHRRAGKTQRIHPESRARRCRTPKPLGSDRESGGKHSGSRTRVGRGSGGVGQARPPRGSPPQVGGFEWAGSAIS